LTRKIFEKSWKGQRMKKFPLVAALLIDACFAPTAFAAMAEIPLSGCYERSYDAAHLA
jgi:hypothetical protein